MPRLNWKPMKEAPLDGTSIRVPLVKYPTGGYDRAFFQDETWWYHNSKKEDSYAAGPDPTGWLPATNTLEKADGKTPSEQKN